MPYDPVTGALIPGTSLTPDPSGGAGGLLGNAGGFGGFSPLTTFGLGLLSQSGPSLTPQSPWRAIGQAGQAVTQAQNEALTNQIYRQNIIEKKQEQEGLKRVQQLFVNNPGLLNDQPLLAGLLSTGYPEAIRGAAMAAASPTFGIDLATAKANLADKVSTNTNLFTNASTGEAAVEFLKAHPGSETLIKNPLVLSIAQGLKTTGDVLPQIKGLLPKGLSDKDAAAVLDAASTLVASKDALAQSGGIIGDTSNVGLDFYSRAFKQARERAETIAKGGGKPFELPAAPLTAFGEPTAPTATATAPPAAAPVVASGTGYQNSRIVPQPAPVYGPPGSGVPPAAAAPPQAPPAAGSPGILDRISNYIGDIAYGKTPPAAPPAQAGAAPTPAKVPTLRYAPNGEPMFRSEAERGRAEKNGWLRGVTGVWVNGKHYTFQEGP